MVTATEPQQTAQLQIYKTIYKKGSIIGNFMFRHDGDLSTALEKAKDFLHKRHLRHVHTTPVLIDLDTEALDFPPDKNS